MARRKKKHEDHINHEAWAIPYADMLVLLLAFFVVMYSISSVNEGKYRVLSSSLAAAFRGEPMTIQPVQFGEHQRAESETRFEVDLIQEPTSAIDWASEGMAPPDGLPQDFYNEASAMQASLEQIAQEMREAMAMLIDDDLIEIRGSEFYIEVEIKADILFPSGVARLSDGAVPILQRIAEVLLPFPNPVQVEGHTDNVPISTERFPSNWELSSARAASVVHIFRDAGIEPMRLAVVGLGEHRPVATNETPEGRNRNRRVVLTVLADPRIQERWFVEGSGVDGADGLQEMTELFEEGEEEESILPEDIEAGQPDEGGEQ
ncbi:flagellar motor protein MotD [Natronospira bacteriovora]|uniref:Flagellar motor protein MotD n=1 Tax=Natronospira bacteriovora TaxID=3069753 RepID=A0ABU0W369_9GAMM|nr:flagellar motor protein MotD [Natronospira sp. AB-CW4]MDQ2068452.1 flagellar motor protein MotD [Natronospira sp. AB-CW4]